MKPASPLTVMICLTSDLSVETLAFLSGETLCPTQVVRANLARLESSSPVSMRTKPYTRSSSDTAKQHIREGGAGTNM